MCGAGETQAPASLQKAYVDAKRVTDALCGFMVPGTPGYEVWQKVLRGELTREAIIDEVKKAGIRGRGGAGGADGQADVAADPAPITVVAA